MAQVTVRVRMNQTFKVYCNAENEDQALDDITANDRLNEQFIEACIDEMEIIGGSYDEPEPTDDFEYIDEDETEDETH